ncbi:hypothetical protein BgiMline_036303, partial [Biomphalaria glabrata]
SPGKICGTDASVSPQMSLRLGESTQQTRLPPNKACKESNMDKGIGGGRSLTIKMASNKVRCL